jgi:hypothetical protein
VFSINRKILKIASVILSWRHWIFLPETMLIFNP